jgi:hypothetical protein
LYSFGLLSSSFLCFIFTLSLCVYLPDLVFVDDVKFSPNTLWSHIADILVPGIFGIFDGAFRCLTRMVQAALVYCIWYSVQPIFQSYGWNTHRDLYYPFSDSVMHLALAWVCGVLSAYLSSARICDPTVPIGYAISLSICAFNVFNFIYTKSDLVQQSQHQLGDMGGDGARIAHQNIYK